MGNLLPTEFDNLLKPLWKDSYLTVYEEITL
jgi:hypothetical protein